MTIVKLNLFSIPSFAGLFETARGYFNTPAQADLDDIPAVASVQTPEQSAPDRARYERLLEHELDRQHLTDVEREDSAMLDRVRSALYAD